MSSAAVIEPGVLRRYANEQLVTLGKLVLENAFQPIVEVGTGSVFGYESLLRGHERIGFASPPELLDQAYEAGQLLALEQVMASRAMVEMGMKKKDRRVKGNVDQIAATIMLQEYLNRL